MDSAPKPRLRFLHSGQVMNVAKLDAFRRLPTDALKFALLP